MYIFTSRTVETNKIVHRYYSCSIEINYILLTAPCYYDTHHCGKTGLPQV